jgi:hypothetical protein
MTKRQSKKNKSPIRKFLFCLILIALTTEAAFCQFPELVLDSADVRLEFAYSNGYVIGYNLFVSRKPGMESVMLTEPGGYYALRSIEWNPVNGSERRELSGRVLFDDYSRYSILSSTPVYDLQFGSAFLLFIPYIVVYGNPSAPAGIASLDISNGAQINVRTFDRKYADPNMGQYQNNLFLVNVLVYDYIPPPAAAYQLAPQPSPWKPGKGSNNVSDLQQLRRILITTLFINENKLPIDDRALMLILRRAFE